MLPVQCGMHFSLIVMNTDVSTYESLVTQSNALTLKLNDSPGDTARVLLSQPLLSIANANELSSSVVVVEPSLTSAYAHAMPLFVQSPSVAFTCMKLLYTCVDSTRLVVYTSLSNFN